MICFYYCTEYSVIFFYKVVLMFKYAYFFLLLCWFLWFLQLFCSTNSLYFVTLKYFWRPWNIFLKVFLAQCLERSQLDTELKGGCLLRCLQVNSAWCIHNSQQNFVCLFVWGNGKWQRRGEGKLAQGWDSSFLLASLF